MLRHGDLLRGCFGAVRFDGEPAHGINRVLAKALRKNGAGTHLHDLAIPQAGKKNRDAVDRLTGVPDVIAEYASHPLVKPLRRRRVFSFSGKYPFGVELNGDLHRRTLLFAAAAIIFPALFVFRDKRHQRFSQERRSTFCTLFRHRSPGAEHRTPPKAPAFRPDKTATSGTEHSANCTE